MLEKLELKPTQPQIVVGVRVWAELGKNVITTKKQRKPTITGCEVMVI